MMTLKLMKPESVPTFPLVLLALGILLPVLLPRRELGSRGLMLLRSLFPSWRFFDSPGEYPSLSYRVCPPSPSPDTASPESVPNLPPPQPGPWIECPSPPPARGILELAYNPEGNLYFAFHTLISQLVSDLQSIPDDQPERITQTASYTLVRNLVSNSIRSTDPAATGTYQFKIIAHDPTEPKAQIQAEEVILLSPWEPIRGDG